MHLAHPLFMSHPPARRGLGRGLGLRFGLGRESDSDPLDRYFSTTVNTMAGSAAPLGDAADDFNGF